MTLKGKLSLLQQKAKERTVKSQDIEYDLETLVKKIKSGVIKLDPDYQRRHRWNEAMASRLIESLILNIPIPTIYISQDLDVDQDEAEDVARFSVIDGQQRLTAISLFFQNCYALEGLEVLPELNDSKYKDLPPFLIRRLEERTIKCLRIDSTVDDQVKYDIFERLNSGSVKLESQELRNAVSRGPFNELIKGLAETDDFRTLLQIDLTNPEENKKVQKMQDVEFVLRYFAVTNGGHQGLKSGFKDFLSQRLDEFNELDETARDQLASEFPKVIKEIRRVLGKNAFAKWRPIKTESANGPELRRASKFNAAVYDAIVVCAHEFVINRGESLPLGSKEIVKGLFSNERFFDAVQGSVNDKGKIDARIDEAKTAFGL